jgi:hypothetical protein
MNLIRLIDGIDAFLEAYEPLKGPPGNLALEFAVREALPEFEELAGESAEIRWNKHSAEGPRPRNPLLRRPLITSSRAFEEPPSVIAILDMIEKVHRKSRRSPDTARRGHSRAL